MIDVQSTDPDGDTEGSGLSYSLTGGADESRFSIVAGTGMVTFDNAPDFENPIDANGNGIYEVQVTVTDSSGLTGVQDLQVTVTNINEIPTNIILSNSTVVENQPIGTLVGIFATTDPDAGNTFTYNLVSGTGSADNGTFTISGNQLRTAAVFDYESKSSYTIRVRSTDQGGLFTEKVFTISDTDDDVSLVGFTLQTVDALDDSITSVAVGETFFVNVFVQDLRNPAFGTDLGVGQPAFDVLYERLFVSTIPDALSGFGIDLEFSATYFDPDFSSVGGNTPAGVIDEVVSFNLSSTITVGSDPVTVVKIGLKADQIPLDAIDDAKIVQEGAKDVVIEILKNDINFFAKTTIQTDHADANAILQRKDAASGNLNQVNSDQRLNGGTTLDITGGTLSITEATVLTVNGGSVTISDNGTAGDTSDDVLIYNPPSEDFNGLVEIEYKITDGLGNFETAKAKVTITTVNDAPTANDDFGFDPATGTDFTATEDIPKSFALDTIITRLLSNDSPGPLEELGVQTLTIISIDGTGLTGAKQVITNGNGSTLTIDSTVDLPSGKVTYDPALNFNGIDIFTYTVTDNGKTNGVDDFKISAPANIVINVTAVNDAPVAIPDAGNTNEFSALTVDVLANDTDVDGDDNPVNFSVDSIDSVTRVGGGPSGTVTIVGNQINFDPGADFDDLDAGETDDVLIEYTMSDDSGAPSSLTLLTITVDGFNNDTPWQNSPSPFDVDGNKEVDTVDLFELLDSVRVIGQHDVESQTPPPRNGSGAGWLCVDVDGNNRIETLDIFVHVDHLLNLPTGEGEAFGGSSNGALAAEGEFVAGMTISEKALIVFSFDATVSTNSVLPASDEFADFNNTVVQDSTMPQAVLLRESEGEQYFDQTGEAPVVDLSADGLELLLAETLDEALAPILYAS